MRYATGHTGLLPSPCICWGSGGMRGGEPGNRGGASGGREEVSQVVGRPVSNLGEVDPDLSFAEEQFPAF